MIQVTRRVRGPEGSGDENGCGGVANASEAASAGGGKSFVADNVNTVATRRRQQDEDEQAQRAEAVTADEDLAEELTR